MIVAIVGRPNVGKSTLFNRLTETKQAIVDEISGVTRDRLYGIADWAGKEFSVIDTGGYILNSDDIFEEEIRKQVDIAVEEANLILFVVDVTSGITDMDDTVAQILRKSNKNILLVVNKVDNNKRILDANEFYKFGLGDPISISSINGSGTGELLDKVVSYIEKEDVEGELDIPKYTVVGRPNVGKSSLINALIGEERNIVTPISGTTRDSIYTRYNKFNQDFYLVDTAGIRKKGKVTENLEFYSVLRSIRSIEKADVCLLLIDATQGMEAQDLNIIKLIQKNNKGLVILVNKWDLIEKETNTSKDYTQKVKEKMSPFVDVPIIFTSVITKQRIHKVLEEAKQVYENRRKKITTSKLNEVMQAVIEAYPPPSIKGKFVKIKYITQLKTFYPSFAFFCNLPQYVKDPYKRYLENKLRENFDFTGSPIQIYMRKK
ncbi:MAG: ribosome biogenesis GTPase Der [Bacteroidales bacterium]|nr:ribosome biogenesis GTPase Der [Bacteroidales bacterium]